MLKKMTIELSYEAADQIVVQVLTESMDLIVYEKDQAKFSWDKREEKKEIRKLRKAFKKVLHHFGKEVDV